jgi:hypothetical protein
MHIRELWSNNAVFSDRTFNYDTTPPFVEATRQIGLMVAAGYNRLVEVGSGDGRYLAYLAERLPFTEIVGSDIASPRLPRARQEHPHLTFIEADAREMLRRAPPRALVLAMNVFGNLELEELEGFLGDLPAGCALTFAADGLGVDETDLFRPRGTGATNYNFTDLIRRHGLRIKHLHLTYNENPQRRATWVVSALPKDD